MKRLKEKRGISALIATVLLILITITGVAIIAGAVIPMISRINEGSRTCTNVHLSVNTQSGFTCYDSQNKLIGIMVARGAGEFELSKIAIIIYGADGNSKKLFKNQSLPGINSASTYVLNVSDFNNITKISVAAIVKIGNREKECDISSVVESTPVCAFALKLIEEEQPPTPQQDIIPPTILFTSPTPSNGSTISNDSQMINVTSSENVSACILEWDPPGESTIIIKNKADDGSEESATTHLIGWNSGTMNGGVIVVNNTNPGDGKIVVPGLDESWIPISNATELQAINNNLGGKYYLTNDIDLAGVNWTPLGPGGNVEYGNYTPPRYYWDSTGFTGRLNGFGNKIENLTLSSSVVRYVAGTGMAALFKYVSGSAIIENIKLVNFDISAEYIAGCLVCSISNYATIRKCSAEDSLVAKIGPVDEYNNFRATGGLIGKTSDYVQLEDCYSNVTVVSSLYASHFYIGGFCGDSTGYTKFKNCFSQGNVNAPGAVGGFLGGNGYWQGTAHTIFENSYWDIETSGCENGIYFTEGGTTGYPEGKTTAQMYQQATYTGWDFNKTWSIAEGSDYPELTFDTFGTWEYTYNFSAAMNSTSLITSSTGDVTPTYTWADGNTKLKILVTFTAPGQKMTYIQVDVKTAGGGTPKSIINYTMTAINKDSATTAYYNVTSLTSGTNYIYWVSCNDTAGNTDVSVNRSLIKS